jgi:hypothetical protein
MSTRITQEPGVEDVEACIREIVLNLKYQQALAPALARGAGRACSRLLLSSIGTYVRVRAFRKARDALGGPEGGPGE